MMRLMVWLGGGALLMATAIDTLSVIGRHIGWPVHGSIELIQPAVLVAGVLALLAATLAAGHACVHIVLDRLPPALRGQAKRFGALVTALFFAGLLAGSWWIMADLWSAHEVSELAGVPWRWMRLFANLCLGATVIVLLGQVLRGKTGHAA